MWWSHFAQQNLQRIVELWCDPDAEVHLLGDGKRCSVGMEV